VHFLNKNIFFYFEKRPTLLQRWRWKLKSCRIGSCNRHLTNVGTYKDISNKVECAKLEIWIIYMILKSKKMA
jgi:hypothetical protein